MSTEVASNAFFSHFQMPPKDTSGTIGSPQTSSVMDSQAIQQAVDVISSEGTPVLARTLMESVANTLLGSPLLSAPDKPLIASFLDRLKKSPPPHDMQQTSTTEGTVRSASPPPGNITGPQNPWTVTNPLIQLTMNSMFVASLLSQMAREFSKLEQAINNIRIQSALEQKDLGIAIGKLRAQQIMMDAAKSFTEGAMHLGMAVIAGSFLAAKTISTSRAVDAEKAKIGTEEWNKMPPKKQLRIELDIRTNASRQFEDISNITTNTFQSVIKFITGGMDVVKSQLESEASSKEATKAYIDKCLEMMSETANKIREEPGQMRNLLQELLRNLKDMNDAIAQGTWRA